MLERLQALLPRTRRSANVSPYSQVWYVAEGADWIIDRIGRDLTQYLSEEMGTSGGMVQSTAGISDQVIHFGSRHVFFGGAARSLHKSNRLVMTWFHGNDQDMHPDNQRMIKMLPKALPRLSKIVTASTIIKNRLVSWGVPDSSIALIPLGVDLSLFKPPTLEQRENHRASMGIPENSICIGSFQKDGQGWGEGLEPKLIKGPDIFLKAIEKIAKQLPVFVLLTGPSRGYVKQGLKELGISFRHDYVKSYEELVPYYQCLDTYLVSARDEGGPQTLLEAMATGVPVISTRVGMAMDVIEDDVNGCLVDVEDVEGLVAGVVRAAQPSLRKMRVTEGLKTIQRYDWTEMLKQYYRQVYQPLLSVQ